MTLVWKTNKSEKYRTRADINLFSSNLENYNMRKKSPRFLEIVADRIRNRDSNLFFSPTSVVLKLKFFTNTVVPGNNWSSSTSTPSLLSTLLRISTAIRSCLSASFNVVSSLIASTGSTKKSRPYDMAIFFPNLQKPKPCRIYFLIKYKRTKIYPLIKIF